MCAEVRGAVVASLAVGRARPISVTCNEGVVAHGVQAYGWTQVKRKLSCAAEGSIRLSPMSDPWHPGVAVA